MKRLSAKDVASAMGVSVRMARNYLHQMGASGPVLSVPESVFTAWKMNRLPPVNYQQAVDTHSPIDDLVVKLKGEIRYENCQT